MPPSAGGGPYSPYNASQETTTAAISGVVLLSALLTMGVMRPLGVATATEISTVGEILDLPAIESHTEFISGITCRGM